MSRVAKHQYYQTTHPLKLYFELAGNLKNDYLAANQPLELLPGNITGEPVAIVDVKIPGLTPIFHVDLADLNSNAVAISAKEFDQLQVDVEALQRITGDFARFEALPF